MMAERIAERIADRVADRIADRVADRVADRTATRERGPVATSALARLRREPPSSRSHRDRRGHDPC